MFKLRPNMLQISLAILVVVLCQGLTEAGRYNRSVVFIMVDDLRPAIYSYGDYRAITPNIDRLSVTGTVFKNAYAQQALCAPSRNSILTSRRPDTLRLYDFYSYWRTTVGNFTTLPQYLKENGWNTYSVGKIFHPSISSNNTDDYPYSWSVPPYHPPSQNHSNDPLCEDRHTGEKNKRNLICPIDLDQQPGGTLPDIESADEAIRILKENQNATQPFFLAVGFHKPHIPFRYPRKYLDWHPFNKFPDENSPNPPYAMPLPAWNPYTDVRRRDDIKALNVSFPYGPIPTEYRYLIRQSYYAAVSYVDEQIGRVLDNINLNDTVVVLVSDHGWSLGEHAEWAKYSNYDVATRVPLIITTPDIVHRTVDGPIELLDIFPTLVELLRLPELPSCSNKTEEACVEGRSLVLLMDEPNVMKPRRDFSQFAISQYPRPGALPAPDSDIPRLANITIMGYSLRNMHYRFTTWIGFNSTTFERDWSKVYGEELYDQENDPEENVNLAGQERFVGTCNHLRDFLKKNLD